MSQNILTLFFLNHSKMQKPFLACGSYKTRWQTRPDLALGLWLAELYPIGWSPGALRHSQPFSEWPSLFSQRAPNPGPLHQPDLPFCHPQSHTHTQTHHLLVPSSCSSTSLFSRLSTPISWLSCRVQDGTFPDFPSHGSTSSLHLSPLPH